MKVPYQLRKRREVLAAGVTFGLQVVSRRCEAVTVSFLRDNILWWIVRPTSAQEPIREQWRLSQEFRYVEEEKNMTQSGDW